MPFFQCGQSLDLCEEIFWKKNPHESCSPSKMAVVDTDDVVHVVDIVGREIHINPWSCLPHPPTVAETKLASIGSRFLDLFRKLGEEIFYLQCNQGFLKKRFLFLLLFSPHLQ